MMHVSVPSQVTSQGSLDASAASHPAPRVPLSWSRLGMLLAGPAALALGCWIYLAAMTADMSLIPGMSAAMMGANVFDPVQVLGLFLMWAVMMAAMMLPTAVPMILAYGRMRASDVGTGRLQASVALFSLGYVASWCAFSLVAAVLQTGLAQLAFMSPMKMQISQTYAAGAILMAAGLYQVMPLKQACLAQCQSPLGFLMTQWRNSLTGAWRMGWTHGLFCVGCCWALMGVLFVAGVMNAVWIIAITGFVLLEKVLPARRAVSWISAIALFATGLWLMV